MIIKGIMVNSILFCVDYIMDRSNNEWNADYRLQSRLLSM